MALTQEVKLQAQELCKAGQWRCDTHECLKCLTGLGCFLAMLSIFVYFKSVLWKLSEIDVPSSAVVRTPPLRMSGRQSEHHFCKAFKELPAFSSTAPLLWPTTEILHICPTRQDLNIPYLRWKLLSTHTQLLPSQPWLPWAPLHSHFHILPAALSTAVPGDSKWRQQRPSVPESCKGARTAEISRQDSSAG